MKSEKDFETTPQRIGYEQILYLYVRSLYRDIPLGDALKAHKYFIALAQSNGAISLCMKKL